MKRLCYMEISLTRNPQWSRGFPGLFLEALPGRKLASSTGRVKLIWLIGGCCIQQCTQAIKGENTVCSPVCTPRCEVSIHIHQPLLWWTGLWEMLLLSLMFSAVSAVVHRIYSFYRSYFQTLVYCLSCYKCT